MKPNSLKSEKWTAVVMWCYHCWLTLSFVNLMLIYQIFYETEYPSLGKRICLSPCSRPIHRNSTQSSVSFLVFHGSSPSLLLYIYAHIHGKVHYCPMRLIESQEWKEERWDWAEQSGKAGAYLRLTNLRTSGLGQWNPVCLWVCVRDSAFSSGAVPLGITYCSFSFWLRVEVKPKSTVINVNCCFTEC